MSAFSRITAATAFSLAATTASGHMSHDDNYFKQYQDFIMQMRLPNGSYSCCGGDDVLVNLPERINADGGYTVTLSAGTVMTRDYAGNPAMILPEDIEVVIPPSQVLQGDYAAKFCERMRKAGSRTCNVPMENMLWVKPDTIMNGAKTIYCYWPTPKGI